MQNATDQFETPGNAPTSMSKAQKKMVSIIAGVAVIIIMGVMTFASTKKPAEIKDVVDSSTSQPVLEPVEDDLAKIEGAKTNEYQNVPVPSEKSQLSSELLPGTGERSSEGSSERPQLEQNQIVPSQSNDVVSTEYELSYSMRKRLSADYQSMVSHFKENKNNVWESQSSDDIVDEIAQVEPPLQNLYDGADKLSLKGEGVTLPAGMRIILISENNVSSDHPGYFTATIVRPFELKGAQVIMESGVNQRNRIPVQPAKIIYKGKEYPLTGQVEMSYNGLEGDVKRHVIERLGPALASAAIGGLFSAWVLSNSGEQEVRVDTRDAIAGPVIQESVTGVQSEVNRLGGDYPNTITVPAGTEFKLLLTQTMVIGGGTR